MLLGLCTAIYRMRNLADAKAWYSKLTGVPPYFDQPFYEGFNVGGYELGLLPDEEDEALAYWGVPDLVAELERAAQIGATVVQARKDVGEGIKVALIADHEGNRISLIENPHFKLAARRRAPCG